MIELLVQFRLRPLKDVLQGLGPSYFEQMSDATRRRWLKSLATADVDATLGSRLESVFAQVSEVRNQLAHSPIAIGRNEDDLSDIRTGSDRWVGKDPLAPSELARALRRLDWLEAWILRLISCQEAVQSFQKQDGEWKTVTPDAPSMTPPA